MEKIIHTLPCLLRNNKDIELAKYCFKSLSKANSQDHIIIYNQGLYENKKLKEILLKYNLNFDLLGRGQNIGIAGGRAKCLKYIWENYSQTQYISEIHLDMIFPHNWDKKLINWLDKHPDEPLICPGILTSNGELHPEKSVNNVLTKIPNNNIEKMLKLLETLKKERIISGFVHPVIHRAKILKKIGGYDAEFFKGYQGYEDDSLLLGYRYYIGLKKNWHPKCYTGVRVYHGCGIQRSTLPNPDDSFQMNLKGLIKQYGIKGLEELSKIYPENQHFQNVIKNELYKWRSKT